MDNSLHTYNENWRRKYIHPDMLLKAALYESSIFLNREVQIRTELRGDFEAEASKLVSEVEANYQEIQ